MDNDDAILSNNDEAGDVDYYDEHYRGEACAEKVVAMILLIQALTMAMKILLWCTVTFLSQYGGYNGIGNDNYWRRQRYGWHLQSNELSHNWNS